MRNFFNFLMFAAVAFTAFTFSSCNNEKTPAGPAVITIETGEIALESIKTTFTPNENTISYKIAIGEAGDLEAFNNGTLQGIVSVSDGKPKEHTFEGLTPEKEYTIFAQGTNADGINGETVTKTATTSATPVSSLQLEVLFVNAETIRIKITPDLNTAKFSYAIGAEEDGPTFEAGNLAGTIVVEANEVKEHLFEGLAELSKYAVFAISENAYGEKGELKTEIVNTPESPAEVIGHDFESTTHSIKMTLKATENTSRYKYAFGKPEDKKAFLDGTLPGIIEVTGNEASKIYEDFLTPSSEYRVFIEAYNMSGETLDEPIVVHTYTLEGPGIATAFDSVTIPVAEITTVPNELCVKYQAMFASKEIWNEVMMVEGTYEEKLETLQLYADFGMTEEYTGTATDKWVLNGYADYEFLFLVLSYDSEGKAIYQEFEFVSPSINTSLPLPEKVEISTQTLTGASGTFKFTPKANTVGFYYSLYTKANYDELYEAGENGDDTTGETYIRDYTAFYGYSSLEEVTETWNTLSPGVEYVMVAAPFNGNGAHHTYGYGPTTLHEFTTPGTGSAPSKTAGIIPSAKTVKQKRMVSDEALLKLKNRK